MTELQFLKLLETLLLQSIEKKPKEPESLMALQIVVTDRISEFINEE